MLTDCDTLIETEIPENVPDGKILVATTIETVVIPADTVWPNDEYLPLPPLENSLCVESFRR